MISLDPSPENLNRVADALRSGAVAACPTDTVYGLAADPFNEAALDALFRAKGRDDGKPVLLVVGSLDQIPLVAKHMDARALACARAFWPGPLSLVLPAVGGLPQRITGAGGKVCVRCPACPVARALCLAFGGPLTSTSANLSGMPPASSLAGVRLEGVELGIDGGILGGGPPSTVFDPETGQLLREGAIPAAALTPFLPSPP
jgi:L-threonylcarbamoyladenylate synthase